MRSYFDSQAASYDEYTAGDNWTPNVVLAEVLFGSGPDVRTVFDLGTGTGQTLAAVAELYPAAQLTGSDLSPEMLARAARRLPDARLIEGEASAVLRTETATFDLVTAIGCLELIPDVEQILSLLAARVAAGGRLALTVEPPVAGLDGHDQAFASGRHTSLLTTAQVLRALPSCSLIDSQLFVAYRRAGVPVLYELLLLRQAD